MEVGGQDFYLDLLFYHLTLRCYVVLDLKTTEFRPDDAGKMNFYLSAADDLLRHPDDQPSSQAGRCARSTTDPEARLYKKSYGKESKLAKTARRAPTTARRA